MCAILASGDGEVDGIVKVDGIVEAIRGLPEAQDAEASRFAEGEPLGDAVASIHRSEHGPKKQVQANPAGGQPPAPDLHNPNIATWHDA